MKIMLGLLVLMWSATAGVMLCDRNVGFSGNYLVSFFALCGFLALQVLYRK